ncbi:hypothetical protein CNR22_12500 [Sphingobacteriaceae bacterium]|nr:hypothetical protein CNR22_12500 [Sphingobacteriaceae bacterium]
MIKNINHIRYKRLIFSVNEYFLTDKIENTADIIYCIQSPKNYAHVLNEFYTLLIDLSQSQDRIRETIYHRTVSEINSFIGNQNFEHKVIFNLPEKELKNFMDLFDAFASKKNIRLAERFRLKAYNKNGILAISYIKQENKFIYINFYRVTKERATNLSSFQTDQTPGINSSNSGKAHRALHWLDILEFKKLDVKFYDFGGWYEGQSDKVLLNINAFKEQFTKLKVQEYTGVIYKNLLLKIIATCKR